MPTIAAAFRDHQTAILDRLEEAGSLLEDSGRPSGDRLDASRNGIGDALTAYQRFKHCEVYDPIITAGGADAPAAAALKADCEALARDYQAYCTGVEAGDGVLASYRRATLDMATRVKHALIREFELVRQLTVYPDYATRPVGGA
ncbi:hypothetical protein Q5H91_08800 [Sphingomonas sp. KR1UV-12]|uniref:PA2169 family four-helix-bundle protein n=1 Tax=Sphingomonas aurea TaxID=3063994 RepID=A0ABT9EK13_9SPHN|nr:hypothetical protein [Sphingomonas sp. KR1UV-12]MDP1027309.1 hypothetical protein [Sphingomonas sp. KR1UV-12]